MASRRKLIVVSNRGPVGYELDASGTRVARRGAGGLVTALSPLVSALDVTWIASALSAEDRARAAGGSFEERAADGSSYRFRLVAHQPDAYHLFYNVVANPTLWLVQHGLWSLKHDPGVGLEAAWIAGYDVVNRAFADAVCDELAHEPEAAVFFHDYHLYLAPRLVRERCPEALLAHFTHIPWVGPDEWSVLPEVIVRAIHEGLLANDVVGFQTERWRRAFLETCSALRLGPTTTVVTAHPVSVDPAALESLAVGSTVLERERELVAGRAELLIVRADRIDPSKNVVRGFAAFERLLERRPDLVGHVQFHALLDPSRESIPEYAAEREAIDAAAAHVEAHFPGSLLLRIADDFPQAVAAYKQFDVLLVNALRDGLNLVVKEAALVNTRGGVVVLSENTGAFEELRPWVISVDPLDVEGQSVALERALELPAAERRERLEGIRAHVRAHALAHWIEAQLEDLELATSMRP